VPLALYIALGSAVGGVARFALTGIIQQRVMTPMPIGTLVVNLSGSLVLGFIMRYALGTASVTPEVRALLTTGFCGGFTTFSTFSYETVTLAEDGDYRRATLYVLASVGLSLLGTLGGVMLAREVLVLRRGG
jgi:CrcB protein